MAWHLPPRRRTLPRALLGPAFRRASLAEPGKCFRQPRLLAESPGSVALLASVGSRGHARALGLARELALRALLGDASRDSLEGLIFRHDRLLGCGQHQDEVAVVNLDEQRPRLTERRERFGEADVDRRVDAERELDLAAGAAEEAENEGQELLPKRRSGAERGDRCWDGLLHVRDRGRVVGRLDGGVGGVVGSG